MRYASSGAGLVGFSRVDRAERREYVVVLNNSESSKRARIPTYVAKRGATKLYGPGASNLRTGKGRKLSVRVPGLSAVVYRINGTIPKSKAAPGISLGTPRPSSQARSRMSVSADVAGRSFYEVTFQAKTGNGSWRSIGTDDSAPYRVFHDTEGLEPGTPLQYRAVVLDNNRHARLSSTRSTAAPTSTIKVSTPADGAEVSKIDPVRVLATVDPERTSQSVRFERSVSGGAWEDLGTDTSSPEYVVTDDVSDLPLGHPRALPGGADRARPAHDHERAGDGDDREPEARLLQRHGGRSAAVGARLPGGLAARLCGDPPDLRHQRRAVARALHAARRAATSGRSPPGTRGATRTSARTAVATTSC